MFKELIQWFKTYYFIKKHTLRLKLAIRLADEKQKAFNKQYFVILSSNDKLISINNKEVERLKRTRRYSENQLRKISKIILDETREQISKMNDEDKTIYSPDLMREAHRKIKAIKAMKLLDKDLDGIKLRKTCFYYTPYSKNNSMTPEELEDAKIRYMMYAKKYLR